MHETHGLNSRFEVMHATRYNYTEPVALCHNKLHLVPRSTARQQCLDHELTIAPMTPKVEQSMDYFGNHVSFFTIGEQHREVSVTVQSEVSLVPSAYIAPEATPPWEQVLGALRAAADRDALDASQFIYDSPLVATDDDLAAYAAPSFPPERPWLEAVLDLVSRINRDFVYDTTATSVGTPPATVLATRRGVCQDFAHLQIACLRLGSGGALRQRLPAQHAAPRTTALIGADASHAWLSAWCPGVGWVDLDPTNNVVPCLDHITVAWGRDYSDVCPIKGVFIGGGRHSVWVSVDVRRVENGQPA